MKLRMIPVLLVLICFLASACQTTASAMVTETADTATPLPATEAAPTETPKPVPTQTETAAPTETSTVVPTATMTMAPSATPFLGFEESILNNAEDRTTTTIFIFKVPGVSQSYFAEVSGNDLFCEVSETGKDLLICIGAKMVVSSGNMVFDFYEDETHQVLVYSGEYYTGLTNAAEPTPAKFPINWAGPETWCPQRGEKLSCETEYRQYDGEPCVATTCYDACGWYYSIDTCPYTSDDFIFIPKPEGW